jgi:AhpD family alkylhydroperoxidase
MTKFNRRTYSFGTFQREAAGIAGDAKLVPATLAGLEPALRERVMLAVTGVNDCRYCRFTHTRLGLRAGLSQAEIDQILGGGIEWVPESERPAVEFARRWAMRNGEEDPAEMAMLAERYGQHKAGQIQMACRLIRLANLSGNTLDSIFFKVSGGWLGA